jgi:c-di-GMP-binding flagellar brake protein YcgR
MEAFDKIKNFPISTGTDLMVHIDGVELRLRSTLIGVKPGEYLIVEMPKMSGIETKVYDGNKVTVIFLSSGVVYGSKVTILSSIRNPSRLIFLSYPEEIERQELRQARRVECYIPATAKLENDDIDYVGVILDISPGGCRYSSMSIPKNKADLFQPEVKIDLRFQILGAEGTQTFHGEIQNARNEHHRISLGVKFVNLNKTISDKIDRYVENVLRYLV